MWLLFDSWVFKHQVRYHLIYIYIYAQIYECTCAQVSVCFSCKCVIFNIRNTLQRDTLNIEKYNESCGIEYQEISCGFYPLSFPSCTWNFLFCLPNCILDRLLRNILAAFRLMTAFLVNHFWSAKIVISKNIDTHSFPAATLNTVSFQRYA